MVYGFVDKKTHAKVNLVVRREGRRLRSYVHYGTGNYHPVTAKVYTDLSLLSCDPGLCRDAARILNLMTGSANPETMEKLVFAPLTLRRSLMEMIAAEIEHARAGKPAATTRCDPFKTPVSVGNDCVPGHLSTTDLGTET